MSVIPRQNEEKQKQKATIKRDSQKKIIDFYRRWHQSSLNCEPSNSNAVKECLLQLYKGFDEAPPIIIWCDSPWQLTVIPAMLDLILSSYSHEQLAGHLRSKLCFDLKSQNDKLWKNVWLVLYRLLETLTVEDFQCGIGSELHDKFMDKRTKFFQNASKDLTGLISKQTLQALSQQIGSASEREKCLGEGVRAKLVREISCNTSACLTGQFEFLVREKAKRFFKLQYLLNNRSANAPAIIVDANTDFSPVGYGKRLFEVQHNQLVHSKLTNTAEKIIWGEWRVEDCLTHAFARDYWNEYQWSKKRSAQFDNWSTLAREINCCLLFSKFCFVVGRPLSYSEESHSELDVLTKCTFADTFSFSSCLPSQLKSINEKKVGKRKATDSGEKSSKSFAFKASIPTPIEIKEWLDMRVTGQDEAKKVLAVAVYQHYNRVKDQGKNGNKNNALQLPKSNVLLVGPSGSGKTMLAHSLAKMLSVPLTVVDITGISKTGYHGGNVEDMVRSLYYAAGRNVAATERGIIFIDEIDKIRASYDGSRDITGEGVQQNLLKIIEGKIVQFEEESMSGKKISVDTSNILFIASGAFVKIEQLVRERINVRSGSSIGLATNQSKQKNEEDSNNLLKQVAALDLIKFGLIPELVGRLPVIAVLYELNIDSLTSIITNPENSLFSEYIALLKVSGVKLELQADAARRIAEEAHKAGTGARGLKAIFEKIMLDIMFVLPSQTGIKKVVIDLPLVEKHCQSVGNSI